MSQLVKKLSFSSLVLALPLFALAQTQGVQGILLTILRIINGIVIPLIIGLAVVYFLWGIATYILSSGDEEKKTEGRSKMIYGIVALAVMVSVWGLVRVVQNTFGIESYSINPSQLPTVPGGSYY